MYQFNEQFTKASRQFADVAANANRLALQNAEKAFGLQLASFEENANAAFAFFGELADVRDFDSLKAVREGRAYGLWNYFNAVPLNILAAEVFAKWLRPDLFADIDPEATLKEINARFAAVPFDGAYWIALKPN